MTWAALIPIIVQFGLPVAEKLWALINSNKAPTAEDWVALKALGATTRAQDMTTVLLQNGIDPASDQGKSFLALVA